MARAVSRLFTARTGLPATAAALRELSDDGLLDLQDRLAEPGPDREGLPPMLSLVPFADGELIPDPVLDALTTGDAGAGVPLMLGFTAHEFNLIPAPTPTPAAGPDGRPLPVSVLLGGLGLTGDRAAAFAETYTNTDPAGHFGQALTDLPFAFDLLDAEGVEDAAGPTPPRALATAVHRAWVAFVTHQDPGPDWPAYTADARTTKIWDTTPRTERDPLAAVRGIWLGSK
ncbi:hypothetical protein [Streptomyces sp. NPDC048623]|uniref:hypothetical protein n=1 Tax=Streptomyces sp. NPDC048623 TaxID=3155761 RepID=UPI00343A27C0